MYELISINWEDTRLHGLIARTKDSRGIAIHIHGTWGNFYGNGIVPSLADAYRTARFDYATLNFPGYDTNAINERIEKFAGALRAWLDFLSPTGKIILQGHSLGALKAIDYCLRTIPTDKWQIDALVLLSPFDIVSFYLGKDGNSITDNLARLNHWKQVHGEQFLVPKDFFSYWDISVGTLLDLATPDGRADVFPARVGLINSGISRVRQSKLIFIGGSDFASRPSPAAVFDEVEALSRTRARLISCAPHNFEGKESLVFDELSKWLKNV